MELAAEPGRGEPGPTELELIVRCIRAACRLWRDPEGGRQSSSSPEPTLVDREGDEGGGIATELGILGLGVFDTSLFDVGEPVIEASSCREPRTLGVLKGEPDPRLRTGEGIECVTLRVGLSLPAGSFRGIAGDFRSWVAVTPTYLDARDPGVI